jgi:hypothetical protein
MYLTFPLRNRDVLNLKLNPAADKTRVFFLSLQATFPIWDSAASIVTALRASRPGNRDSYPWQRQDIFFFNSSKHAVGPTAIPTRWIVGEPSPVIKRLGREVDNSSACCVEAKPECLYTFTHKYVFIICTDTN